MKLRIGTINCQNNEENRSNKNNNALILANHIIDKKYDIVGTQEVTISFTNNLINNLIGYNIYGNFQYGKGIINNLVKIVKDYNQANQIITKYKSCKTRTYTLPWIPFTYKDFVRGFKKKSIFKRLMTLIKVNINNYDIYILNAHLDYYIYNIQKKQLDYIYKRISKLDGKVILMGDFNLDVGDELFINFINKLESIGIKRVPMNEKTNDSKYSEESAIDHVFVSNEFNILDYGTYDDLTSITDHKAIYVDIELE